MMTDEIRSCSPKSKENEIKQELGIQVESPLQALGHAQSSVRRPSTPLVDLFRQQHRKDLEMIMKVSKENEIKQVPTSEAETEEFGNQVESPLNALGRAKSSVRRPFNALGRATFILETWVLALSLNWMSQCDRRTITEVSKENSTGTQSGQSLALLISVMGIFAGGAYVVPLAFRDVFPILAAVQVKTVNLSIRELFTFPSAMTEDFLFLIAVTITFISSMMIIMIAVCFIFRKWVWGTSLTILSLFTIVAFSLSFFTMLNKLVPHSITIAGGYLKVPAILIVLLYDIYVIFLLYALAYIAKGLWSFWHKQDAGVVSKIEV